MVITILHTPSSRIIAVSVTKGQDILHGSVISSSGWSKDTPSPSQQGGMWEMVSPPTALGEEKPTVPPWPIVTQSPIVPSWPFIPP